MTAERENQSSSGMNPPLDYLIPISQPKNTYTHAIRNGFSRIIFIYILYSYIYIMHIFVFVYICITITKKKKSCI